MKIILSRKGFDSKYGGCASPIFPDGTMLSLPIPTEEKSPTLFRELRFGKSTYQDIWDFLNPKHSKDLVFCHLDPDIRANIRSESIAGWRPAFGQTDTAEIHLHNNGVDIGDLFLFFGWFRKVEEDHQGKWHYCKEAPDIHAIYGYLQIGQIVRGEDIREYFWHPHASSAHLCSPSNTLYVASDRLVVDGVDYGLPGSGVLDYNDRLMLTKPGMKRSRWRLFDWMITASISYHTPDRIHKEEQFFQSAARGQEFVISDNQKATQWALDLLMGR